MVEPTVSVKVHEEEVKDQVDTVDTVNIKEIPGNVLYDRRDLEDLRICCLCRRMWCIGFVYSDDDFKFFYIISI